MQFSTIVLSLSGTFIVQALAQSAQFQAFSADNCGGAALGVRSTSGSGGVFCFTLDSTAHAFDADTDGCVSTTPCSIPWQKRSLMVGSTDL